MSTDKGKKLWVVDLCVLLYPYVFGKAELFLHGACIIHYLSRSKWPTTQEDDNDGNEEDDDNNDNKPITPHDNNN